MTDKRAARRERLRENLVQAAHRRVGEDGLSALRARDLASEVGCALGAIYTVFDDLDALALAVNLRTLERLNDALETVRLDEGSSDPADRLVALAHAYCDFAAANPNHWRAVFELRLPKDTPLPAPFSQQRDALFQQIAEPLAALMPEAGDEALALRARTLFSAVHGIVAFWLEERFEGSDAEVTRNELEALIRAYGRGT